MRRRYLLALYVLAGCASPQRPPEPVAVAPAPAPQASPAQAAATPAAEPPISIRPPTASGYQTFDAWAAEFQGRALAAGIRPEVFAREMAGLTPDPRVESLDNRQPEFSKPVSEYLKGVVTPDRAAIGQRRRVAMPEFAAIEQRYGVPREILLGVWALESGFGAIQGDMDVIRSLATLAAQGRRRAW